MSATASSSAIPEREWRDGIVPAGRWEFDADVADVFDDMLERSIPQYEAMRSAVTDIASHWLRPQTGRFQGARLLDLGSSRGEAVRPILDRFGVNVEFTLTENSQPMLDAAVAEYEGWPNVKVREADLRHELPVLRPQNVVTAILTLLFIPVEFRQHLLASAFDALEPGGALIVVEKLLPDGPVIDRLQTGLYYKLKALNGYSSEQIMAKRESLQGVQVCLTDQWNVDLLHAAGFEQVDCFWRWMQFAGYVAVKP